MHPQTTVDVARCLSQHGVIDREVAQIAGVSLSAVRKWRTGSRRAPGKERRPDCPRCTERHLDEPAYAYLLGLYLGDGWLTRGARDVYALNIACCDDWPGLMAAAKSAMAAVMPSSKVFGVRRIGMTELKSTSKHWPCLFPQHGPGKKHTRTIELAPWQRDIVARYPGDVEAGHLKVAKQDAFDSIIALTQARAVSYDANADESRYLVDPGRAAQYQQSFLAKSQRLADVGNVGLFGYDAALAADIRAYSADNSDVAFGGYLGAEFRNITFTGERAAAVRTLLAYQVYERDDRVLRALAKTNLAAAVAYDTGTAHGQSDWAFSQYDAALSSVIAINSDAFASAVAAGQGAAGDTDIAIYAAGAALLAGLVIFGVRPRLAEYH